MLIDFRVRNYRSIKDEQTLSLVASKDKSHMETHTISTGIKGIPKLVKGAVLYGANASGKSNLISAINFMRAVVAQSATGMQLGQAFNVQPFRLDKTAVEDPSEFEITFLEDGIRYQYGFKLTKKRVYEEWLLVYKTPKAQEWFSRRYDPDTQSDNYDIGSHLTGQRKLWQESTRENSLFLSTAVQLNSEQLRPIFNWITNKLLCFVGPLPATHSIQMLGKEEGKRSIEKFLASADISITDIHVVSRKEQIKTFQIDIATGKTIVGEQEDANILLPQFRHETEHGSAIFELNEESPGTQRLFSLAGPVLDVLKFGLVLIVDELDGSLHPLLLRHLVNIFHDPTINTEGAQLIFTTHDASLLDTDLFRRDQIWFFEKNRDQATKLYPLTDFSPRKNEALEFGYLMGRYGAVPLFYNLDL